MVMAETSAFGIFCGRNVRGRNVRAKTSVAEMSAAEMSEHRCSFTFHTYKNGMLGQMGGGKAVKMLNDDLS